MVQNGFCAVLEVSVTYRVITKSNEIREYPLYIESKKAAHKITYKRIPEKTITPFDSSETFSRNFNLVLHFGIDLVDYYE